MPFLPPIMRPLALPNPIQRRERKARVDPSPVRHLSWATRTGEGQARGAEETEWTGAATEKEAYGGPGRLKNYKLQKKRECSLTSH